MTRAILYLRFSPRPDAADTESLAVQRDHCVAWIAKQGCTLGGEFADPNKSGADVDRPGLWDAIAALKKGDVLVCYKLDRLARDVALSFSIQAAVEKRGAHIVSAMGEGTWGDTPGDKLVRTILSSLDEYNRIVSNIRTQAAMMRHQRAGRRMSSPAKTPYGWAPDPNSFGSVPDEQNPGKWLPDPHVTARLVEVPDEQEFIREVVDSFSAGESVASIIARLNTGGVKCRGHVWRQCDVRRILKRAGLLPTKAARAAVTA